MFCKNNYVKESYCNGELALRSVFSNETYYFRLNKEYFGYVRNLMGSDILAEGCSAQKSVGSTEKLTSLHINQGDEIFKVQAVDCLNLEDGNDRLSRNVGNRLPI